MTTIRETATLVGETVNAVRGAAQDMRRTATGMLDKAGIDTTEALHTAASAVREAGNNGADAIDGLAIGAGHRFASASTYLGQNSSCGVMYDVKRMVRRHPGSFVLVAASVAAVMGYLAGSQNGRPTE